MTEALLFKLNLQLFAEDDDPGDTPPGDDKGDDVDSNYLDTIKDLKEKNAEKDKQLKKAVAENKKLLKDYLDGDIPPAGDDKVKSTEPTIEELRDSLYVKKDCKNNLEYFKKTLKLREKVMEQGEIDPFVPIGKDMTPEQRHFDDAARIAKHLQECVDSCEDDPEQFNRLLDKKIIGGLPEPGRINR